MAKTGDEGCKLISYRPLGRCSQLVVEFVPEEVWVEILSRVSLKSLPKCQLVCKKWRRLVYYVMHNIKSLPVCGLLFFPYERYLCLKTKDNIVEPYEHEAVISSGYDTGCLAGLSFDFNSIIPIYTSDQVWAVHRKGLILSVSHTGTYAVHNPTTNEIFVLPEYESGVEFGTKLRCEKNGILITFPGPPVGNVRCHFVVMTFCRMQRVVEIYDSRTNRWSSFKLRMEDQLLRQAWDIFNYVGLVKQKQNINMVEVEVVVVYMLTHKDRGVAVRWTKDKDGHEYCDDYGFSLPEFVRVGGARNPVNTGVLGYLAVLGESQGCLYLCHFGYSRFWIWKSTTDITIDADALWTPFFVISRNRMLCKPVARQHLAPKIVNGGHCRLLAFHPDAPIVFLLAMKVLYAYDLTNDRLDTIVEDFTQVCGSSWGTLFASPFVPYLGRLPNTGASI